MKNLEPLKIIDTNKEDINNFVTITDKAIISERLNEKIKLIEQLLGHIKQLLVRIENVLEKEKLTTITTSIDNINKQLLTLKDSTSESNLKDLDTLYIDTSKLYENIKIDANNIIHNANIEEYNNLITKVNQKLEELKNIDIAIEDENNLITLYNNIKNNINPLDNLHNIILLIDNILIKPNLNKSKGDIINRKFLLFAKINDQIINSLFKNKNNLIYACYTLEDNSKYYAIVKSEEEINIIDQSFTNLPNLVLTKDNIINTCKIIINNATIYYNINEYMRYIEKSYKTKMTEEIDEVILKYKKRLTILEQNITNQLTFIDQIALLVNNKPSSSYPNITYNDVPLNEYFKDYNKNLDSKTKEIERLIVEVLLNDKVTSTFETSSILKTLYDEDTITDLITSDYSDNNSTPKVNTNDNIKIDIPSTKVTTNYERITTYLNSRVKELNLLINSPKINVTITKEDDSLFKDINTVLDLHTAIVICDKVYKKGQGIYALCDYLKTGNTVKFTSKFGARELVSKIDRSNYIKLLFENIIKRYLATKDDSLTNFINTFINKEINVKDIIESLLEKDELITLAVENFDYDYLDNTNDKSKKINELLNNKEDLLMVKLNNILENIKRIERVVD